MIDNEHLYGPKYCSIRFVEEVLDCGLGCEIGLCGTNAEGGKVRNERAEGGVGAIVVRGDTGTLGWTLRCMGLF